MTQQQKIDYLDQYKRLDNTINSQLSVLSQLKKHAGSVTQREKDNEQNNLEDIINRIKRLERSIDVLVDQLVDMRLDMEREINSIDDIKLSLILKMRYIDGKTWPDIQKSMGIISTRGMFRYHKQALLLFSPVSQL